ncbi:TlpA disulfide reductase family protein [Sphingomonas sp.]|uniref:TlpA family protein disulfide reductase n=1 Tax=Sphingomonas sp. TaxID=28214 RepID=UPI0025E0E542|nr:TlpA disulfide reductase family protein [Sphingomonas sp.]
MRAVIALLLLAPLAACDRQTGPAPQANVTDAAKPTEPEPAGTLDISQRGKVPPSEKFTGPDGKPTSIAAFAGKPVLVNLWATWCGPCVKELPSLDRLAVRAGDRLQVLVVNQDDTKQAVDPVPGWWAAHPLPHLALYRDAPNALGFAFASGMLPTTVLYDANGKEVWRIVGGMDWDGPRANTLLAEFVS